MSSITTDQFPWVKIPCVRSRFKYSDLLTVALIWSYLMMPFSLPYSFLLAPFVVLLGRWGSQLLLRELSFEIDLKPQDLAAGLTVFLGLIFFLYPFLSLPLGSDEPHHLERALFLLKGAFDLLYPLLPAAPFESFQGNFWNMYDPRVLSAQELWVILFWTYLATVGGILWLWNRLYAWEKIPKQAADLIAILSFVLLAWVIKGWPDQHPPLRTLFPFLTVGLGGLNPLAARISGVVSATLFFLWVFKSFQNKQGFWSAFGLALFFLISPVVLFNSLLIEASIYGFYGTIIILIYLYQAMNQESEILFFKACALVPILVLFRQPAIIVSLACLMVFVLRFRKNFKLTVLLGLLSCVVVAPYFWMLKSFGNSAGEINFGLDRVVGFLVDGKPVMNILGSHGVLWTATFLLILVGSVSIWRRTYWLLVYFALSVVVFHCITIEGTWGLPRYQLDFFLPALMALFYVWSQEKVRKAQWIFVGLGVLSLSTYQQFRSVPVDLFPNEYQALRISNTSFLPDDQAISHIKRIGGQHNFLIVGGTVPSFESLLWFQGFDLWRSRIWLGQTYEFQQILSQVPNFGSLRQYFELRGVKYLALIEAQPRDVISQSSKVKEFLQYVKTSPDSSFKFVLDKSFQSSFGGTFLDVYRIELK